MRVVVAHGRAGERRRFQRVLSEAGHEVAECDCAGEAFERCRDWQPDVVVADDEAGDGLLARIKRDAEAFRTAVLLVEPAGLPVDKAVEALSQGAQDVLIEPVRDAELLTRVHAAGRTKGLQEEIVAQAERLEALLFEDPLTGLANRRSILTQLTGMVSAARRHQRPLTVAMIDIDHFKAVNDTQGHAAGDKILAGVAQAMRDHLRAEDQLGRLGGEEFLALLPDADARAAKAAAEKLRVSVAETGVTVSIGWAAWDGETADDLLGRADEALYTAKERGRDCVVGAPATLPRRT
ncbi:MAG TPA: diguanylate cyclase [Solirubrobacteraceae bacterium]|nr:diguanylate cyclase [Solirubrobacteraceae bacterium]